MPRTCVFCASSMTDDRLHRLARVLGTEVARAGDELVYGGTLTGLMADVALGARAAGGRVVGVLPRSMAALASVDHEADELVVVESLGERKQAMADGTDRFVVLAGGLGTLDELIEVMTMRQLGLVERAVDLVVLDPTGHWSTLRRLLDDLVAAGVTDAANTALRWVTTVADALDADHAGHAA